MEKDNDESVQESLGDTQQAWKLYLGGIPVNLTEVDLEKLFEPILAKFKVTIMKNPEQGNSKGCGFLEVYTKTDFKKAKKAKIEVQDKFLQIEEYIANEEERRKRMFENNEKSIHVGGLPLEAGKDDLEEYFSNYGKIVRAYIIFSLGEEKKSRGFGFVQFNSKKSAKKVLNMPHKILGKDITVSQRHTKKEIKGGKNKDSTKAASITGSSLSSKSKTIKGSKKASSIKMKAMPSMDFSKTSKPMSVASGKSKGGYFNPNENQQSFGDFQQVSQNQGGSVKSGHGHKTVPNIPYGSHYQEWGYPPGLPPKHQLQPDNGNMHMYNHQYGQQDQYWQPGPGPQFRDSQMYLQPGMMPPRPGAMPPGPRGYTQYQSMPPYQPGQPGMPLNQFKGEGPNHHYWGPQQNPSQIGAQGFPGMYPSGGYRTGGPMADPHSVKSQPVRATQKAVNFTYDARTQFNPFSKQGKQVNIGENASIKSSFDNQMGSTKVPAKHFSNNEPAQTLLHEIPEATFKADPIAQDLYKLIDSPDEDQ